MALREGLIHDRFPHLAYLLDGMGSTRDSPGQWAVNSL